MGEEGDSDEVEGEVDEGVEVEEDVGVEEEWRPTAAAATAAASILLVELPKVSTVLTIYIQEESGSETVTKSSPILD